MPDLNQREIERRARTVGDDINRLLGLGVRDFRKIVDKMRQEVVLAVVERGRLTSSSDIDAVRGAVATISDAYIQKFHDLMSTDARRMFVRGIYTIDKSLEAGGVRLALPYLSETLLERTRSFQADLVTNLTEFARNKIKEEIQLATLGQKPTDEVVSAIGRTLEGKRSVFSSVWQRANIIYTTEMSRVANMAAAERFAQAQTQIPDLKKKWQHSHLGTPRINHLALDGTIVSADGLFELKALNGQTYRVAGPHDPKLPPGEVINCKCVIVPVVGRFSGEAVKPKVRPKPVPPRPIVKPPPPIPPPVPRPAPKPPPPPTVIEREGHTYGKSENIDESLRAITRRFKAETVLPDEVLDADLKATRYNTTNRQNASSYYNPNTREITLNFKRYGVTSDATMRDYLETVVPHEHGHRLHFAHEYITYSRVDPEWQAIMSEMLAEWEAVKAAYRAKHGMLTFGPVTPEQRAAMTGADWITRMWGSSGGRQPHYDVVVETSRNAMRELEPEVLKWSATKVWELQVGFGDLIMALTRAADGGGHDRRYMQAVTRHMEAFAHGVEIFANDNPFFRHVLPQSYMKLRALIARKLAQWKAERIALEKLRQEYTPPPVKP